MPGSVKGVMRVTNPSYDTVHARLFYTHGRASEFNCADCGEQAEDWAYDHTDEAPSLDERGRPYSVDLTKYRPLCRKCHRALDKKDTCRKGHLFSEENTYLKNGKRYCRECRKLYMRDYRVHRQEGEANVR